MPDDPGDRGIDRDAARSSSDWLVTAGITLLVLLIVYSGGYLWFRQTHLGSFDVTGRPAHLTIDMFDPVGDVLLTVFYPAFWVDSKVTGITLYRARLDLRGLKFF